MLSVDDLSRRATFAPVPRGGDGIRIRGYGERFELTDQSILNHHFRASWHSLPYGYNLGVKVKAVNKRMWSRVQLAV